MTKRPDPNLIHCATGQDWPDPGEVCCMGAAVYGPGRCTCWEPVLDIPVTGDCQEGPMGVRTRMCGDCAFRPDSPERTGADGVGADAEDLADVVIAGQFLCHDGMPRPVEWRHPSGLRVTRPGDDVNYSPRQARDRSWRQDGQPALMCAGWAARRRALLAGVDRAADCSVPLPEEVA